eukprot:g2533.t1
MLKSGSASPSSSTTSASGPPTHWQKPGECQIRGSIYVCGQHSGYGCEAKNYLTATPFQVFIGVVYSDGTTKECLQTSEVMPLDGGAQVSVNYSTVWAECIENNPQNSSLANFSLGVRSPCYQDKSFPYGSVKAREIVCLQQDVSEAFTNRKLVVKADSYTFGTISETPRIVSNLHSCVLEASTGSGNASFVIQLSASNRITLNLVTALGLFTVAIAGLF